MGPVHEYNILRKCYSYHTEKKYSQQGDLPFVDAKRRGDNVFSKQVLVLLESRYNAHIHLPSLTTGFL